MKADRFVCNCNGTSNNHGIANAYKYKFWHDSSVNTGPALLPLINNWTFIITTTQQQQQQRELLLLWLQIK